VTAGGQGGTGIPWPLLAGAGLVLVALLTVGTPAGIRVLQRRRRVATGTAGSLWDELAATALDVGVRLHPSWTPRRAATELAGVLGSGGAGAQAAADAVTRLARAEETASYGRNGDVVDPGLGVALRTARAGLLHSVSRDVRLRARLWPASLVAGAGTRLADRARRRLGTRPRLRRPHAV
jgi:hypothetical protein